VNDRNPEEGSQNAVENVTQISIPQQITPYLFNCGAVENLRINCGK
jgi:hypothetical protein